MTRGYRRHRIYQSDATSMASSSAKSDFSVEKVTIDAREELERLRRDFVNRVGNTEIAQSETPSVNTAPTANREETASNGDAPGTTASATPRATQGAGGFFDNPTASQYRFDTGAELGGTSDRASSPDNRSANENDAPAFSFSEQPQYRPSYSSYRPRRQIQIPWRAIFTIAAIILAVVLVCVIWNARYAILNGIIGFFVSLLPTALLIGGVVYLVRNLFR